MKVKRTNKKAFTTVSIPTALFNKVEEHIGNTGFVSVSSYVAYILRTIISEPGNKKADYEASIIKKRLKQLGYI